MTTIRPASARAAAVLAAVVLSAPVVAGGASLLPATPGDLVAEAVVETASPMSVGPRLSPDPVQFAWVLDPDVAIDTARPNSRSMSREYWLRVSGNELRRGIAIDTTARGAIVRLSPLAARNRDQIRSLNPDRVELVAPDGRRYTKGAGLQARANADQLAAAGADFPEGTSAFRIRDELGSGRFVLRAPDLQDASSSGWVVQVFEPSSPIVLELGTDASAYLAGGTLVAAAKLSGAEGLEIESADGALITPDGSRHPLVLTLQGSRLHAQVDLEGGADGTSGLWEVQARVTGRAGGRPVQRDVRTAFAVARPTARLTGEVEADTADGVALRLGVETGAAGRYGVRGVLWGSDATGALHPLAAAQAAAVLGSGRGRLELHFSRDILDASSLTAPYELRGLELDDQGRMGVLHYQARALVLD